MKRIFMLIAIFCIASAAYPQQLRKYGQQTTVDFTLVDPAGVDLEIAAVCAAGDIKISKNGAAWANTSNCFTEVPDTAGNRGVYSIVLLDTEMQAARIQISIMDTAPKVWLDHAFSVITFGHVSAMMEVDLDDHDFAVSAGKIPRAGTVNSTSFTPTATDFETTDASVTQTSTGGDVLDQTYRGRVACFTSGALDGNCYTITATDLVTSGRLKITITAAQQAPANGVEFTIQ